MGEETKGCRLIISPTMAATHISTSDAIKQVSPCARAVVASGRVAPAFRALQIGATDG